MQREYPSPESCTYAVGVVGEGGRVHQHGSLEVTPTQIIYTPDNEQDSYIWPLRYLIRYYHDSNNFTIEAGSQCPLGAGLYTFSTDQASELYRIVARNTTSEVMSPRRSATTTATPTTDAQTTSHRPPPSFPPPSPPPTLTDDRALLSLLPLVPHSVGVRLSVAYQRTLSRSKTSGMTKAPVKTASWRLRHKSLFIQRIPHSIELFGR